MYILDTEPEGFEWIDCEDTQQSVISFLRWSRKRNYAVMVICNFTPVPRHNYRVGAPFGGLWKEELNSDAALYGGSGQGNLGGLEAAPLPKHGRPYSLNLTLPPLSALVFRYFPPGENA